MTKIFMFVNVDWFFLSHRLPIAEVAKDKGVEMTVLLISLHPMKIMNLKVFISSKSYKESIQVCTLRSRSFLKLFS